MLVTLLEVPKFQKEIKTIICTSVKTYFQHVSNKMNMKTPAGPILGGTLIYYFTLNLLQNKEITLFFQSRGKLLPIEFKSKPRISEIKFNLQTVTTFKYYFAKIFYADFIQNKFRDFISLNCLHVTTENKVIEMSLEISLQSL